MDNNSNQIVKVLLNLSPKSIWSIAQKHTHTYGDKLHWSSLQSQNATAKNYNTLMSIKYKAENAIKEQLTPDQRILLDLSEKDIHQLAASEIQKQSSSNSISAEELKFKEDSLYQYLIDEQKNAKDLMKGNKPCPGVDLAGFDTTDLKNGLGLEEMRNKILPYTPINNNKQSVTRSLFLMSQNAKEYIKNPFSAFMYKNERESRNQAYLSGKSFEEANLQMQQKKDQNPLKIISNFFSGDKNRQDRAIEGTKGFLGNFMSGEGAGAKLIPALGGFAATKFAGLGNVTSIVVALLAAIIVPMIMRAFNGSKKETIPEQETSKDNAMNEDNTLKKEQERSRKHVLQQNQELKEDREISRPSNNLNNPTVVLDEKSMMAHAQENGLCSLRKTMGADNPHFKEFIKQNGLESTLKEEELKLFNGTSGPIAKSTQVLNKQTDMITGNIADNIKNGVSIV